MIQGFVDTIAIGYLKDSIESDIESYGLSAYLEALRSYLEDHPEQKFNDVAVMLNEVIDSAIDDLDR